MSDKFFDKDDNFILWKDEGDLTKASKYVGGRRADLKTNESLTKKIAKGDIEIGREYGMVDSDSIEVNWGKCGGTEDVIVTYNEGDDLWIPNVFLSQAFGSDDLPIANNVGSHVGYQCVLDPFDSPNAPIVIYKLPQELGEWLYKNAENMKTESYYGQSSGNTYRIYHGIAIYPDNPSAWTDSTGWGIGIRKKNDIVIIGHDTDGNPTVDNTGKQNTEADDNFKALEDDAYYLVAQFGSGSDTKVKTTLIQGQLNLWNIDDKGSDHIYFRHVAELSQVPDASHKASKYTCPKSICKRYGIIEKALTVNWGKCGGEDDVIVTYNEGDPLWIPKEFFPPAWDSYNCLRSGKYSGIGYYCYDNMGNGNVPIAVYNIQQDFGKWLYEHAESTPDHAYYYMSDSGWQTKAYKGIAIYPDTLTDSSQWSESHAWGIGIRKGSDICVGGWESDGTPSYRTSSKSEGTYDPDTYYLVHQAHNNGNTSPRSLQGMMPIFGDNKIYLRHFSDMRGIPNGSDNMGEKYTCPSELCSDNFTFTETKDSITVNWGKCGGNEDVIVNYNVGEGIWVPKDYLLTGFKSDGLPKDYTLDIKDEIGWVARYDAYSSVNPCNIYKLPQKLGEWLYNNSESTSNRKYNKTTANYVYSNSLYKGIAIYPDTVSNWSSSIHWGVGIRKASDLDLNQYYSGVWWNGGPTDASLKTKLAEVDPNAYYLVAQVANWNGGGTSTETLRGQITLFGNEKMYLRHFESMTMPPHWSEGATSWTSGTDDPSNIGEKYQFPQEWLIEHPTPPTPNEDQVEIDWGAGIKTYYKYGEPMYIPRAFLMEAFDPDTKAPRGTSSTPYGDGNVGYYCWEDLSGSKIAVYVLPQELGKYLYESAESMTDTGYYGQGNYDFTKAFKGIAIYPDTLSDWSTSTNWGVGIRKGSNILTYGHDSNGNPLSKSSSTQPSGTYENDVYYLTAQLPNTIGDTNASFLYGQLNLFPKDEPIWMRHFKDMTSAPSATNMGKKMVYHPEYYALPLGGKIFYIDPSNNGATYTFFDEDFNEINNWSTISDLANAKYYSVKGTPSKDKFYVYYPTKFDSLTWGYNNITTGATGTTIGTGKTNTATVMARTDIATGTTWSKLSEIRTSSGLGDWFIPSKDEVDKFRVADLEVWARKSGGSYLGSSSEYSAQGFWYWNYYSQSWGNSSKTNTDHVFFTRSF